MQVLPAADMRLAVEDYVPSICAIVEAKDPPTAPTQEVITSPTQRLQLKPVKYLSV